MDEHAPGVAARRTRVLRAPRGSLARAGAVLAVATLAGNVLSYVLVLALSRLLPAADYGAVGALLNLAVIGAVPALAVQLVAARETARGPAATAGGPATAGGRGAAGGPAAGDAGDAAAVPRLGVLGLGAGGVVGAVVLVASPLLDRYLHLGSPWAAVALGLSLAPAGGTAAAQGVLQGAERFGRLSLLLVLAAGSRCVGAAGAAALGWGVTGAIAGTLAGAVVTLAVAVVTVPTAFGVGPVRTRGVGRRAWRDVAGSSTSTAGLLTFVNLDVLLARHDLPAAVSGLYAVGSVFTKVTFWGPAFLATLLYPRMTAAASRDRAVVAAIGLTAGLGGLVVVGSWLGGGRLVALAAGGQYAGLGRSVALFAALGTAFAVVQVLIYARVAVRDRWLGAAAWVVAAGTVLVVAVTAPRTVTQLVTTMLAGACVLVAAGLVRERRALRAVLGRRAAAGTAAVSPRAPVGS